MRDIIARMQREDVPAAPPGAWIQRLATLLATGFGSGYSPVVPGTAGSFVGLLLYWPIARLAPPVQAALVVSLSLAGIWSAARVARAVRDEDPGIVVVDEFAGMWVSLLFLPLTPFTAAAGFVLFRVLDVIKPFPAKQFERLPGGLGIVADDLMAGVYANLLLRLTLYVWPA
jgi:phosphatidylglycerophosphatase A